ncbi:hypothetical protein FRC10_006313, partial [Ceratobasidium sp. 414]
KEWLAAEYMQKFCQIDGRRLAGESSKGKKMVSKESKSQTVVFKEEITMAFCKHFPWKDPVNSKNDDYLAQLRKTTVLSASDWLLLPNLAPEAEAKQSQKSE